MRLGLSRPEVDADAEAAAGEKDGEEVDSEKPVAAASTVN